MELQSRRTIAALFPLAEGDTNELSNYLEDNAITKKEYPNFPKAICLFFVTQIGFTQLPFLKKLYRLLFMIMQMCLAQQKKHN
jgi:hypothetical protein